MSVKEFRAKLGGAGVSDDQRLLRYFAGEDAVGSNESRGPGTRLRTNLQTADDLDRANH